MSSHSILFKEEQVGLGGCSPHHTKPYVTAVMPCLNEEKTVALCVIKALACFTRLGISGEVIVSDNGSIDHSIAAAEAAGAIVVRAETKGYGAALSAGIRAAQGSIIIMGDSDDSYDWSNLDGFINAIEAGNDLVMGNRFQGGIQPRAMPPLHRYIGNPILSLISRIAFNVPIGDFHCGMRAFTPTAFRRMGMNSPGMEFATEMVANSAREGLKIAEIPIKLYPDKRDRPPHLRSFRDGWRHLRFILSHAPDHVFVWPGVAMTLLGIALITTLLHGPRMIGGHYFGIHFVILGAMLSIIGTNVIPMGIMAKMILGFGPSDKSGIIRDWLSRPHLLEGALVAGGSTLACGLTVDFLLLARWLGTNVGMEDTIHTAIAASTAVIIGIEVMFSSLLIYLTRDRLKPSQPA
jgi:glycosyltransferase involved in cell wall biosynthesis